MTCKSSQFLSSNGKAEKAEVGSGNVFADLGFRNAEVRLLKAKLATRVAQSIEEIGLSQRQIREQTGLGPAEISRLLRGQLSGFSTDRLITILNGLESTWLSIKHEN
jgi:predicted XRE-type DNA-binding protein